MNSKVDGYLKREKRWKKELVELRRIILSCPLVEELKWGEPCYTYNGGNVVLIHGFKNYCALLFMKGALIDDGNGILIQQTENVQAGRQIRFTSAAQILEKEDVIRAYIRAAIEAEAKGLKVRYKAVEEFKMPAELTAALEGNPALAEAFRSLTPGRQRAYILHFAAPKQATTRNARIEKFTPKIIAGKGLHD